MKYLVNEVHGKATAASGAARIFDDLPDAIKFITGINKNQKLLVNGVELNEEEVGEALKEKLSTVSVSSETDKHRRWLITAF